MWGYVTQCQWLKIVLLLTLISVAACSTQQQHPQNDMLADTNDPFTDPFFTRPPEWNDSVLRQSEVLAQDPEESQKPQSFLERSEGVIFSTVLIGAALAKLALPFLGLGF